ncbi:Uncharacterised protein [uncultured archaeon]|nr:Uncharacterised protein [uncultured archaeon]
MKHRMDSILKFDKNIFKHYFYYFAFAALALVLVKDFFSPGYIMALDMVFAPGAFRATEAFYGFSNIYSILPLLAVLDFLNIFFTVEIIQKLLFFLIFFVSGVCAYRMCPDEWGAGRYFAGFLYVLNPFIYVRFLAGHWLILLAYAATPFVIKGLMDFFEVPSTKKSVYVAILLTFVFALETHTPFLLFIVFCVFLIVNLIDPGKKDSREILKSVVLMVFFLLLLNLYWLVPGFAGNGAPLGEITTSDLYTFTTTHDAGFNTLFTTASMYGFWRGGYIYAKDLLPYWYLLFIFILFLSVHGFVSNYRNPKHGIYVRAFGIIAVISVFLASGISGPFAGIFEFLFNNIFFFKGFREPHKFVGLLVLSYAYLGGLGVSELEKAAKAKGKGGDPYKIIGAWLIIALALLTPFIYSFTMFNGFWGQLKPGDYPEDWYEVNNYLNEDKQDFKVLFLPWHLYMDFNWLPSPQKRIANPANIFFGKPVIQGDNMEAGPIYSSSSNPVSRYIEFLLGKGDKVENFGELLVPLNVKYILLTKEVDYKKYDFLYNQDDLEVVKDTENLVVFRNRNPVSRFYQADNITSYEFGIGNDTKNSVSEWQLLNYTIDSPVKYTIEQPSKRYVIFSDKYADDWKLDGKAPLSNFGVTNAYDTSGFKGNILYNHRFNIYLTGYLISVIGFIFLIYFYYSLKNAL